jgi:IS30 family transposase
MKMTEEQREKVRRLRSEGMTLVEVARAVGCSLKSASRVHVRPSHGEKGIKAWYPGCRRLSYEDRERIAYGLAHRESFSAIAQALSRSTSTISREVKANGGRRIYRVFSAHNRAYRLARRPKVAKLDHGPLAEVVTQWLEAWWSPEEIAHRLPIEFPHDPMMRVSYESIYQSIYVQGRGELRRELARCLRSGRRQRKSRGGATRGGARIRDMVLISDRPAEIEDRAVPGHWEGDLLIGKGGQSQVGTLVERASGYLALVHLRDSRDAPTVARAMAKTVRRLPDELVRSITWDQGREMGQHARFTVATGVAVYFCDPHSPWQRGTNENTNGLLRQYLPKGTDLSKLTRTDLDAIALSLNDRPRKRLGYMKPSERFAEYFASTA